MAQRIDSVGRRQLVEPGSCPAAYRCLRIRGRRTADTGARTVWKSPCVEVDRPNQLDQIWIGSPDAILEVEMLCIGLAGPIGRVGLRHRGLVVRLPSCLAHVKRAAAERPSIADWARLLFGRVEPVCRASIHWAVVETAAKFECSRTISAV